MVGKINFGLVLISQNERLINLLNHIMKKKKYQDIKSNVLSSLAIKMC